MPEFPQLAFVLVQSLLIHEHTDEQRRQSLELRLRANSIWRNPPVVSPFQDDSQRYLVLEGANRVTALEQMGYPHALVQIIEQDDPGLSLQTWNHVVWSLSPLRFLAAIRDVPGLHLAPLHESDPQPGLEGEYGLAIVQSSKGRRYIVGCQATDLETRIGLLNALVDTYQSRAYLDRTSTLETHLLSKYYPSLSGLVIFPNFKIFDLMRVADQGCLLPTGITRFAVSPRALHLNYPLEELAADKPIDGKNAALKKWIQERIAHKGVRYYAEPIYLFDA
jgi:hypothetical protein